MSNWLVYDCYIFAAIAFLGTIGAAIFLVWIVLRGCGEKFASTCGGIQPQLIGVLGMLFGLALAFLANDTWSAHDRASAAINREADSLRSILILTQNLPPAEASEVRQAARTYTQTALAEWPLIARRQTSPQASRATDTLLSILTNPRITAQSSPSVSHAEIDLALAVRDGRDTRITIAQTHVNLLKWGVMAFLGFVTMLSIVFVHVGVPRAMIFSVALFAIASAPTAAIVLIHSNPFQQPLAVTPEPLVSAIAGIPNIGVPPPPFPPEAIATSQ